MTTHIIAVAQANSTFVWTMDFSQVVAAYPAFAASIVRMQVKTNPTDTTPLIEFVTGGVPASADYNSGSQTVQFLAPQSAVSFIAGLKYFDIRFETEGVGEIVCAYGVLNFVSGPTVSAAGQNYSAGSSLPDSVIATTWDQIMSAGPNPVSISSFTAILAETQAVEAEAAASAVSAASSASAAAAIAATNWGWWPTLASFAASSPASGMTTVGVFGINNPGDCSPLTLVKLGSPPSPVEPWHVETANSQYWVFKGDPVDARWFGADPTGTDDSTTPINNAILYANAIGGGKVWIPGGSYLVDGTIACAVSGVSIEGDGQGMTILNFGAGTANGFAVGGVAYTAMISGFRLRGMRLNMAARTGGNAIYIQYSFWPSIEDVDLYNCWNGLENYATNSVTVDTMVMQGVSGSYGLYWHAPADGTDNSPLFVVRNVAMNLNWTADGVWLDGWVTTFNGYGITALHARVGFWVKNSAESANYVPEFVINYQYVSDGCTVRSVQIDGGRQIYWDDCWCENTSTPGAPAPPSGQGFGDQEAVLINGDVGHSYTSDIRFTGGKIGNSKTNGVTLTNGVQNVKFLGVNFEPGGKGSPGTYSGVVIGAGCADITVLGCDFHNFGSEINWLYAVTVAAGTFRVLLEALNCYGEDSSNIPPIQWSSTDAASYCGKLINPGGINNQIGGKITPQSFVGATQTATAAKLLGGVLQIEGSPGAGFTVTTDTAANMVAQLDGPCYLLGIPLLLINSTSETCTLVPGAGVTLAGNLSAAAQMQIGANAQRAFMFTFTETAPGSEAVTIYG